MNPADDAALGKGVSAAKTKNPKRGMIIAFSIIGALLVLLVAVILRHDWYFQDRVAPGVRFGNVSVMGKTESELTGIVNQAVSDSAITVTDSEGTTIDSWTSTTEDHEIDALAPGKYTLTEQRTPTAYDQAESIEFEVRKTGEVQTVTMYDSPISISGEIDKRQEIADPTAKDTDANGDGLNTAGDQGSDDGSYAYTIDFRSTSNTWTDEFTVEDDLTAAVDGQCSAHIDHHAAGLEDYDGR